MRAIRSLHDFIDSLTAPIRDALIAACTERSVAKDQTVYHRGDQADALFQLIEGGIRLSNHTINGKEIVLEEFRPGDCFGEMAVLDGLPRHTDAIATMNSRIRVLSKPRFDALMDAHPEISRQLNVMLSRRLRLAIHNAEDASSLSLEQRIARTIHRLVYSQGTTGADGAHEVHVSHDDLARMLGASRQSVSKELTRLKRLGCIETRYGKLFITDLPRLQSMAETLAGAEQFSASYDDHCV